MVAHDENSEAAKKNSEARYVNGDASEPHAYRSNKARASIRRSSKDIPVDSCGISSKPKRVGKFSRDLVGGSEALKSGQYK